ncbi:MAG: RNA degradosome polyphosphate kinase [Actinobacteria bacterium]|nr:RNA degradosome polyphosphate kinase [Actinomycetota bacterium]
MSEETMAIQLPPTGFDLPNDRFFDREISWLAFNERVLELAEDESIPLLERVNFLSIFSSNLDEFFMVRVAGLKRRIATGLAVTSSSGLEPAQVLTEISRKTHQLQERQAKLYLEAIEPALSASRINITKFEDLDPSEKEQLSDYYRKQVFPVLTPLAVDPAHPFPYISGLSLNIAVMVKHPDNDSRLFARVKVPPTLPRFVRVPGAWAGVRFVVLEDLIGQNLGDLFEGMEILQYHNFRVTRNEDLEVDEDETDNLLQALEAELARRRFGPAVRLEVSSSIDPEVLELLKGELDIEDEDVYSLEGPLDLTGLSDIAFMRRPELHYLPHQVVTNRYLKQANDEGSSIFSALRQRDILLHHPYESFSTSVQAFIEQAAKDPKVFAIKQTLYRTSGDSPIVDALISAAKAGKQVLALVEIKARFDEQNNIGWARKLEQAGVHVVYGIVGLKTHCKLAMVIRHEDGKLKRYCHIGTGNYNPKTARFYEDYGLLTARDVVGEDVAKLFNRLSAYAEDLTFSELLVSPVGVRQGLTNLIAAEMKNAINGKPSGIQIKLNSLVDEGIIDSLYRASMAGVKVEILVRGMCAMKAGVPGLSENITVRSVLGRYLEHSRVFRFLNDNDPVVYIGSADMMHRNLDRRVETLVRIRQEDQLKEMENLFSLGMSDESKSWHLQADGTWLRNGGRNAAELVDVQDALMSKTLTLGVNR